MNNPKKMVQSLLPKNLEECGRLLNKDINPDKNSIYNLNKMPGVTATPAQEVNKTPIIPLSEGLKQIINASSGSFRKDDDDSEDGYLPATLRSAISVSAHDRSNTLSNSPPDSKRKKTKQNSLQRTKSEKDKGQNLESKPDSVLSGDESPSEDESKLKTEEPKELEVRKSEDRPRKPKPPHQRREKGRVKKTNSSSDAVPPSKPASLRKSKSSRKSKSKPASHDSLDVSVDRYVDWRRMSIGEEPPTLPQRQKESKPKKQKSKKSTGSAATSPNGSKPKSIATLQPSGIAVDNRQDVDLKRSSPCEEQRKKSSPLQKKRSQKVDATKDKKSNIDKKGKSPRSNQRKKPTKKKSEEKPKSRRTLMITSKATTQSCRSLLRKIDKMNDDRITMEKLAESDENEAESGSSDELPQETVAIDNTNSSPTTEAIGHSDNCSDQDGKDSSPRTPTNDLQETVAIDNTNSSPTTEVTGHSNNCSDRDEKDSSPRTPTNDDEDEDRSKPPRTKSAPLRLIRKAKSEKPPDKVKAGKRTPPLKKSVKKTISGGLMKIGWQRKAPMRSASDTSLPLKPKKRGFGANYDLMLSMHSIVDEPLKELKLNDNAEEDIVSDAKNDTAKSFSSGDDVNDIVVQESKLGQTKTSPLSTSKNLSNLSTVIDDIMTLEQDGESDMFSTASFNEATHGRTLEDEKGLLDDNMDREKNKTFTAIDGGCDDMTSMAEFSSEFAKKDPVDDKVTKGTKKAPSCLQIDFSQLSEHGTTGNIVVRNKRLGRRVAADRSTTRLGRLNE